MSMSKLTRRAFAGLVTAGLLASVSAGAVMAQEYTKENPLKVAIVVHGTLGDKSFLDSAAVGLARAEAELPVDVTIIEAGVDRGRWQPALGYAELARELHDNPAPDAAAIREQLGRLSGTCKGCHDDFKIKD